MTPIPASTPHRSATPALPPKPHPIATGPALPQTTTQQLLGLLRAEQQAIAAQITPPGDQTVWLSADAETAADRGEVYYTAEHPNGLFLALSSRTWWERALPAEAPAAKEAILTALRRRYLLTGVTPVAAALALLCLVGLPLLTGGASLSSLGLAAALASAVVVLGAFNAPSTCASVQMRDPSRNRTGAQTALSGINETADWVLWPFRSGTTRPVAVPAETTEVTTITVLEPTWPALREQSRTGLTMVFIPRATEADLLDHPTAIGSVLTHLLELHRLDRTDRSLPGVVATQAQIQHLHDQLTDPAHLNYQSPRPQH